MDNETVVHDVLKCLVPMVFGKTLPPVDSSANFNAIRSNPFYNNRHDKNLYFMGFSLFFHFLSLDFAKLWPIVWLQASKYTQRKFWPKQASTVT